MSDTSIFQALAVRDWLLGEAREISDPNVILEGLCLKLRDAERAANGRVWEFGSPAREQIYAHNRGSEASGNRPLAEAHRLNEWIFSWLPDMPDDTYDIIAALKAAGYTHHVAIPVVLPNGLRNGFTFATRAASGFSPQDIAVFARSSRRSRHYRRCWR